MRWLPVIAAALALSAAGCGSHHTAARQHIISGREWQAALNDWLDNRRFDHHHSCGAVVETVARVSGYNGGQLIGLLDHYAGKVCTHRPKLDAIVVGMTDRAIADDAGMPRTLRGACRLYPVTSDHDGRRVCFTNGRVSQLRVSEIVRVICRPGATPPVLSRDFIATPYGPTCATLFHGRCTVWAKRLSHPPFITRRLHYRVAASFCAYARRFLAKHPKGYAIELLTPGPHHR